MTHIERNAASTASADDTRSPSRPVLERIETHAGKVGQLPIHRAIPNRQRRMVGAWCFLDHAGPIS